MKNNKVLLVKEFKESAKNKWGLPGGKVEIGESLEEAVKREFAEETGLICKSCSFLTIVNKPVSREGNTVIKCVFIVNDKECESLDLKEHETEFFSLEDLHELNRKGLLRGAEIPSIISKVQKSLSMPGIMVCA